MKTTTTTTTTPATTTTTTTPETITVVKEKSGWTIGRAIVALGVLILLGMLWFGACTKVLPGSTPTAPPGVGTLLPSSAGKTDSGPPSSAPLVPRDTEQACVNDHVYAFQIQPFPLAMNLCGNHFKEVKNYRFDNNNLYFKEGDWKPYGNLDSKATLSKLFGKNTVDGERVDGSPIHMVNPYVVTLFRGEAFSFCRDRTKKGDQNDPVERYIEGICFTGRPVQLAKAADNIPRVGCCPSQKESTEIMRRLKAIEEDFKAHERRPLPPAPAPPVAFEMPQH